MSSCPLLGCIPMTRGERRRAERELKHVKRAKGAGQGWRLTSWHRRRYRVIEPVLPVDVDRLIAESDAVARRLGCTCVEAQPDG